MKKIVATLLAGTLMLAGSALAKSFEEGVQYVPIQPQPPVGMGEEVEVVEFFWYGCPHCYSMEPYLNNWLTALPSDVEFIRVPATFQGRENVMMHARTFYALEQMGILEQHHEAIFQAIEAAYLTSVRKKFGDTAAPERTSGSSPPEMTMSCGNRPYAARCSMAAEPSR